MAQPPAVDGLSMPSSRRPRPSRPWRPRRLEPSPARQPVSAQPVSAKPASAEPVSAKPASAEPSPAEPTPVSLQTIANAYRDYTRKSLEEFGSFVEQLSGVRSLDKAMTVQTEFVKRAYETSVAKSQKICELHNRLAKQTLDPFKGPTGKKDTRDARQVLRFTRNRFDANFWYQKAPVFRSLFVEGHRLWAGAPAPASLRRRSSPAHVVPLRPVAAGPDLHDLAGESRYPMKDGHRLILGSSNSAIHAPSWPVSRS